MGLPRLKRALSIRGTIAIWKRGLEILFSRPSILAPFLILAAAEALGLGLLSVSPHFPVNVVLAPPIKSIWGAVYLHYPYIYVLLPKLFYFGKMVIGIFVGSLTSGMAVFLIYRAAKKEETNLKAAFSSVFKHYISLFLLLLILYVIIHFLSKEPLLLFAKWFRRHPKLLFLGPGFWIKYFLPVLNFVMAVFLQGLFVYAVPYIVIGGRKFLSAFWRGARLFFRFFLKTLVLVAAPMALYIPVTMLQSNLTLLQNKFMPEVAVPVLLAGILMGTVIIDAIVTIATTLVFTEAEHEK